MRKIIENSNKFEIELQTKKLQDVQENNWFKDDVRLQFTFPFEFFLDDVLDEQLGMLSLHNTAVTTLFPVTYFHNENIAQGELEILEINDRKASAQLVTGVEQLPSWDLKLQDLDLLDITLPSGTTIYQHAQSIITQSYPNVDYNFPQIHTEHKTEDEDFFFNYLGRINNRDSGGNFYTNSVDAGTGERFNRNIMQPLPAWLYLLEKIAEKNNLTLTGTILQDALIQKMLVYGDRQYFERVELPNTIVNIVNEEGIIVNFLVGSAREITKTFTIAAANTGVYNLKANILSDQRIQYGFVTGTFIFRVRVLLNNNLIYDYGTSDEFVSHNINLNFNTIPNVNNSIVILMQWKDQPTKEILTGQMEVISLHSDNGEALPNKPIVNLKKAVPDITCGDFLKLTKTWFNYDWNVEGNNLIINKIVDDLNDNNYFDLTPFQPRLVPRKFNQGFSFILKYQDTDDEKEQYIYQKIYHGADMIATDNYTTNQKTQTIEIPALPLPNALINGVMTAHAFERNESKVYAVLYNGLINSQNLTLPHQPLLMPAIHEVYWRDWFAFRLKAQTYRVVFRAFYEQIKNLKVKVKPYAYNKFFVPRTIERNEISPDLFEISIEMDSIEK